MANNFATKLHIDNRRLSALYEGPSSANPQKRANFDPKMRD